MIQSLVEMTSKVVAGILASETQEHIVPPKGYLRIARGSHGWIATKLQEQNLEEEKRGSLMLRQWWWGCPVLLSHLSFA